MALGPLLPHDQLLLAVLPVVQRQLPALALVGRDTDVVRDATDQASQLVDVG